VTTTETGTETTATIRIGADVFDHAALDGGDFFSHQRDGITWLLDRDRAVLADEPGLGKTIQVLGVVAKMRSAGLLPRRPGRVCVLWLTQAELMSQGAEETVRFCPGLTVTTHDHPAIRVANASSAADKLARAFPDGLDVLFAGHATAAGRVAQYQAYQPLVVVVDELSALKGGQKWFDGVREITAAAPRVYGLTATPLETNPAELWHALAAVQTPGLPTWADYASRLVIWSEAYRLPGTHQWVEARPERFTNAGRQWAAGYLPGALLRRTAEQAGLSLPRVFKHTVWVPLDPQQTGTYRRAMSRRGLPGANAKEKAGRAPLPAAILDWLASRPDVDKAIAYAHHHEDLDTLAELLGAAGISFVRIDGRLTDVKRKESLDAFRGDPAVRVLLGSSVLERGLNLQNARVLLNLDSSWNPAREQQRLGRICRIGSPHESVESVTFRGDTAQGQTKVDRLDSRELVAAEAGLR
jgi:hypothetical protein